MKKLLGILAVVALFAVPMMAADVPVTINVATYAEMTQPAPLVMAVTNPEGVAIATNNIFNGRHQAESIFSVTSNYACTLTVVTAAGETTGYKTVSQGMVVGPWPTAWLNTPTPHADGIGYGIGISGAASGGDWVPGPDVPTGVVGTGSLTAGFIAGTTTATVKINSYMDSNRIVGVALAQPGQYTGTLIFTLALNP